MAFLRKGVKFLCVVGKEMKRDIREIVNINKTDHTVYEKMTAVEPHIPKMHPVLIPNYKRLLRLREIYQRNDGYPLYMKEPWDRFIYRMMWAATLVQLPYSAYLGYKLVSTD